MIKRDRHYDFRAGTDDFLSKLNDLRKIIGYQLRRQTARFMAFVSQAVRRQRVRQKQKIRRHSVERVYRLKGYTTVAKINRKRQAERQQRFLRKFLFLIIALLIFIFLFTMYNPFKDLTELYRIIGIDDFSDLTQTIEFTETTDRKSVV